jgi:hypothetical protein
VPISANERLELEEIGRQAVLVLYASLNAEITAQQTNIWAARDAAFWPQIGKTNNGYAAESVPAGNFYVGHVPSLIEADIAKYPNVAAYAFTATPLVSDDSVGEMYDIRLAVEIMCKADSDEEEVNSRVHRTVEAAHSVLSDPTFRRQAYGGFIWAPENATPAVTIGDVFVRRQERSRGDRWFWQGGRLEYRLERYIGYV